MGKHLNTKDVVRLMRRYGNQRVVAARMGASRHAVAAHLKKAGPAACSEVRRVSVVESRTWASVKYAINKHGPLTVRGLSELLSEEGCGVSERSVRHYLSLWSDESAGRRVYVAGYEVSKFAVAKKFGIGNLADAKPPVMRVTRGQTSTLPVGRQATWHGLF